MGILCCLCVDGVMGLAAIGFNAVCYRTKMESRSGCIKQAMFTKCAPPLIFSGKMEDSLTTTDNGYQQYLNLNVEQSQRKENNGLKKMNKYSLKPSCFLL